MTKHIHFFLVCIFFSWKLNLHVWKSVLIHYREKNNKIEEKSCIISIDNLSEEKNREVRERERERKKSIFLCHISSLLVFLCVCVFFCWVLVDVFALFAHIMPNIDTISHRLLTRTSLRTRTRTFFSLLCKSVPLLINFTGKWK